MVNIYEVKYSVRYTSYSIRGELIANRVNVMSTIVLAINAYSAKKAVEEIYPISGGESISNDFCRHISCKKQSAALLGNIQYSHE